MAIIAYADSIEDVDVIPTGLFFDKLSGIGGVPRGYITEIFGDEGIGKSSLCLQIIAAAQKRGLKCLFVDVEWSYIPKYAASLGVDNSKLGLIRYNLAEDTLNAVEEAAESGKWDLIVFDSIGGVLPRSEAEKDADGKVIGGQAKLIATFCRKVVPILSVKNVALIVINHSFTDIMSAKLMTSGGRKLAYHKALSIRLKTKYGNTVLKQGDRKVGKMVVGVVHKNKVGDTEGLEVEAQLIFGTGFSIAADLLGDAIEKKLIVKKGNTYYLLYNEREEKLGIGLSKVRKMMEDDAVLSEKVKQAMQ